MKLSEITGDRALDIIADILPVVGRLKDSKALDDFYKAHKTHDLTSKEVRADLIFSLVPSLIKSNKQDILQVVASVTGTTVREVKKLSAKALWGEIKEILSDPEMQELFGSSVNTEQAASSVSSPEAAGQSAATE